MPPTDEHSSAVRLDDLSRQASEKDAGLLREVWAYIVTNKKWWLIPIVVVLLMVAALVLFSGTPLMPFVYTFI